MTTINTSAFARWYMNASEGLMDAIASPSAVGFQAALGCSTPGATGAGRCFPSIPATPRG
jgi:hypothetical protein